MGQIQERHTSLRYDLNRQFLKQPHGLGTGEVVMPDLLSLCTGKSDFEAVGKLDERVLSPESVGRKAFPSPVTVRQRLDEGADRYLPYVQKAAIDVLLGAKAPVTALSTGHVALDVDVTPMDNSNTKKEGIGWTYKQMMGYAQIAGYLGQEGWCLGFELREGTQHCQKDTPGFLRRVIQAARRVTKLKLLVRLDGGNDALENYALFQDLDEDTIIGLYRDHGNSEQFHSELKSELDLERLPSGKFATNALILELDALAYNVLRLMGWLVLGGYAQRHPTK